MNDYKKCYNVEIDNYKKVCNEDMIFFDKYKTFSDEYKTFSDKYMPIIAIKYSKLKKSTPNFINREIASINIGQLTAFFERFFSTLGWENTAYKKEVVINNVMDRLVSEIKRSGDFQIPYFEWQIIVDKSMTAIYRYYFRDKGE